MGKLVQHQQSLSRCTLISFACIFLFLLFVVTVSLRCVCVSADRRYVKVTLHAVLRHRSLHVRRTSPFSSRAELTNVMWVRLWGGQSCTARSCLRPVYRSRCMHLLVQRHRILLLKSSLTYPNTQNVCYFHALFASWFF